MIVNQKIPVYTVVFCIIIVIIMGCCVNFQTPHFLLNTRLRVVVFLLQYIRRHRKIVDENEKNNVCKTKWESG